MFKPNIITASLYSSAEVDVNYVLRIFFLLQSGHTDLLNLLGLQWVQRLHWASEAQTKLSIFMP